MCGLVVATKMQLRPHLRHFLFDLREFLHTGQLPDPPGGTAPELRRHGGHRHQPEPLPTSPWCTACHAHFHKVPLLRPAVGGTGADGHHAHRKPRRGASCGHPPPRPVPQPPSHTGLTTHRDLGRPPANEASESRPLRPRGARNTAAADARAEGRPPGGSHGTYSELAGQGSVPFSF